MYNKFYKYIKQYDTDDKDTISFWYEGMYSYCMDYLSKFSDDDWNKLIEDLPKESNNFKKRLIFCLRDPNNIYHNIILYDLLKIDDFDIFQEIIFTLANCNFDLGIKTDLCNIKKIKKYFSIADYNTKKAFDIYLDNIEEKYINKKYDKINSKSNDIIDNKKNEYDSFKLLNEYNDNKREKQDYYNDIKKK